MAKTKRSRIKVVLYLSSAIVPVPGKEKNENSVTTFPANGEVGVSIKYVPRVIFKGEEMDKATLTHLNIYLIDEVGSKVACSVQSLAGNTVLIHTYMDLLPQKKYYFRLNDQLKDINGNDIKAPDKQIYFTTGG